MEDENEVEQLEALAAKTLRPSRMMGLEDLLASELASAVLSDPLNKIRHVCEALMLLDAAEMRAVGIAEEEARESRKIHTLATTLLNAYINREIDFYHKITIDRYAMVPWPFPREQAKEWLDWINNDMEISCFHEPDTETKNYVHSLPFHERIHFCTSHLETSMSTYNALVIRFVDYAMPIATRIMKKIVSLVSADSYLQALRVMKGKRKKEV
ncbi:MAG: hypothetical protein QXH08_06015 [Candidatus Hadarchaeales archaeon]